MIPEFGSLDAFVVFLCGVASHYFGRYIYWLDQGRWLLWANLAVGLALSLYTFANGFLMLPDWALLSIVKESFSSGGKDIYAGFLIAVWPIASVWLGAFWSIQHVQRVRHRAMS